jgi:hypothetical protein
MWFSKKKQATGPVVWMIQKRGVKPALFLGVCKDQLVTLGNWKACFRFSDIDAASLMIYWMLQAGKVQPGEFEAVPVQLQAEEIKR